MNDVPPPARGSTLGKTVARSVMTTSASQLGVIVAGFATSIAQARLLGAAGRGDVTRFANAGALAAMYFGLGINSAITYFLASGSIEPRALMRILKRAFPLTFGLVLLGAMIASTTELRRFLPHALSGVQVIAAIGVYFGCVQLGSWLAALLTARADFAPMNVASVSVSVVAALSSVTLWLVRPAWAGPATIIWLVVGLEVFRTLLLAGFALRRESRAPELAPKAGAGPIVQATLGQLVRYSFLSFAGEALQFLTYRFDMWVVDAYWGVAELGRYSLAVSLAQMVWIVPVAAARVLFPYAARLPGPEGAALAWRTACISLGVCALAAAVGFGAAQVFLTTLFGKEFGEVPSLLGILLLGIVPYSITKVLANYLSGINQVAANMLVSLACLVITMALDFTLIPRMGARGAAWATAVTYSACSAMMIVLFARKSSLSVRSLLGSAIRIS
jgi:O-antigen/teichoic acid export membrane protein